MRTTTTAAGLLVGALLGCGDDTSGSGGRGEGGASAETTAATTAATGGGGAAGGGGESAVDPDVVAQCIASMEAINRVLVELACGDQRVEPAVCEALPSYGGCDEAVAAAFACRAEETDVENCVCGSVEAELLDCDHGGCAPQEEALAACDGS